MSARVLIVDDSELVRSSLRSVLSGDPEIQVVGAAADPYEAIELMNTRRPNVLTLDIEMPRMDGLTFLKKIMEQHPIPVIICSTLAERGAKATLVALEYGAVDIITKPKLGTQRFFEEARIKICDAVKAAAKVGNRRRPTSAQAKPEKSMGPNRPTKTPSADGLIVIGASTGGTEALLVVLESLPKDTPPVAIVQHMPGQFTQAFAQRLDGLVAPKVKEARSGEVLRRGEVMIAPGEQHLLLKRSGSSFRTELRNGPLVSRHRPSVDVLFRSAAKAGGARLAAAILTGMGSDGAKGMKELFQIGAHTIAQDAETSVVHSMPLAAIKSGSIKEILPLAAIGSRLVDISW